MTLTLHLWERIWQSVTFDTELGRGRVRWLRRAPVRSAGWAVKHAGTWYAIWGDGTQLIFQVGARQLPMTDAQQCRDVRFGTTRKFTITEREKVLFELVYDALDRDQDFTFDDADLEQEDFFVHASRLWNDPKWKADVVRNRRP